MRTDVLAVTEHILVGLHQRYTLIPPMARVPFLRLDTQPVETSYYYIFVIALAYIESEPTKCFVSSGTGLENCGSTPLMPYVNKLQ